MKLCLDERMLKFMNYVYHTLYLHHEEIKKSIIAGTISCTFYPKHNTAIVRSVCEGEEVTNNVFFFCLYKDGQWEWKSSLRANPTHAGDTEFGDDFLYHPETGTLIVSEPGYGDGVLHAFNVLDELSVIEEFDSVVCTLTDEEKPEGYELSTKFPFMLSEDEPSEKGFTFTVSGTTVDGLSENKYRREVGHNCIELITNGDEDEPV